MQETLSGHSDTLSFKLALKALRPALMLFVILTIITGVIYPLVTTVVGQWWMPFQANGSLIEKGGVVVGSSFIGQNFTEAKYFWSRPSATGPYSYNAAASSGANQGPLNPALADAIKIRIAALREADTDNKLPIPVDLVTASASGLDPHISPAAAQYQLTRVVKARGLSAESIQQMIDNHTESRQLSILGEPRVNVLQLNLALDSMVQP